MFYLATAYAAFWAITFVLVFSISSRQKRLERELAALREVLANRESPME